MLESLNGATRVHLIVGDPIAQVKSPAGVTQAMQDAGHNAVLVPLHVAPADLAACVRGASLAQNVDGIVVTVPHKFSAYGLCATATERAHFLQAVNVMRRASDRRWHGDMCDGAGFVDALRALGGDPAGKRVLLIGAGGAGSAIAQAVVLAGARALAVHDESAARRDTLLGKLAGLAGAAVTDRAEPSTPQARVASRSKPEPVRPDPSTGSGQGTPDGVSKGSPDPTGYDIVINATPVGMREGDPMPLAVERLTPQIFVADVITVPAVPPLIAAARALGCRTLTGADMFARVRDRMVAFLLGQ